MQLTEKLHAKNALQRNKLHATVSRGIKDREGSVQNSQSTLPGIIPHQQKYVPPLQNEYKPLKIITRTHKHLKIILFFRKNENST